jgi:hypothetical protein
MELRPQWDPLLGPSGKPFGQLLGLSWAAAGLQRKPSSRGGDPYSIRYGI